MQFGRGKKLLKKVLKQMCETLMCCSVLTIIELYMRDSVIYDTRIGYVK
ncbi:hypothetical protein FLA_5520 [Filimonas lacunae]|nr:hypothetical protein FLA_5520 [Filimonas lacunae]